MARLTGNERAIVVTALRHAVPYIRMFKRKTFVLKAGGDAFESAETTRALMEQIGILHQVGIRVVLVHGGGPQSTELASRLGLTTQMVDGRRVTDEQTLKVSTMILNGEINTRIVAMCRALGIPAIGISGVDGGMIKARKRAPMQRDSGETIDYGFVGDIHGIDASIIVKQLDNDLVPVISPLSADDNGTLLNINADTVAAAIACELHAEKFVLATGTPGILESLEDPRSLISYIDRAGLRRLRDEGRISGGMLPKLAAIERALSGGVPRVHVISYTMPDSLLLEVFTNEGTGTLVVNDIEHLSPEEQSSQDRP
jgi:acetylglutamate kinase